MEIKINVLAILDEMDSFRRSHQDQAQASSDYCMRVLESILAKAAGFNNRNIWTDMLLEDKFSRYSIYIRNG